ncbi:MAG: hypothetical protein MR431_05770 [Clostridia bacterium]|jgi:hypothetical protein|nr:hypothetical protein [Clostridia bacterium]
MENSIAKILRAIGIVEVICGILVGFYFLVSEDVEGWIGITVMISSLITCMLFVGFGEIINLLQKNADKQDALLEYLKGQPLKDGDQPKSVLQDIESNLPEM